MHRWQRKTLLTLVLPANQEVIVWWQLETFTYTALWRPYMSVRDRANRFAGSPCRIYVCEEYPAFALDIANSIPARRAEGLGRFCPGTTTL